MLGVSGKLPIYIVLLLPLVSSFLSLAYYPCHRFRGIHDNDTLLIPLFAKAMATSNYQTVTSLPSSSPAPRCKQRLFIFGNGNVAKSVVDSITNSVCGDRFQFESIVCTVRKNDDTASISSPPSSASSSRRKLEDDDKILCNYVSFEDEQEVVKKLKQSTHILITIPPQQQKTNNSIGGDDHQTWNYVDPVLDHHTCNDSNDYSKHRSIYSETIVNSDVTSWIGFVSTTGVYGNHDGAGVDETSETRCKSTTKASAYLDVEQRWDNLLRNRYRNRDCNDEASGGVTKKKGIAMTVFRCAGLYGNKFSALHTVWKRGFTITPRDTLNDNEFPGDGTPSKMVARKERVTTTTSRIHLDDVGRAIRSSMNQTTNKNDSYDEPDETSPHSFDIYNLADDESAPRTDVMKFANDLLHNAGYYASSPSAVIERGVTPPSIRRDSSNSKDGGTMVVSERAKRRTTEWKRVLNFKMKRQLLEPYEGQLLFPTFRDGLKHILESNTDDW